MKKPLFTLLLIMIMTNIFAQDQHFFIENNIEKNSFNRSLFLSQEIYLPGEEINFTLLRKHLSENPVEINCALNEFSGKIIKEKTFKSNSGRIQGKFKTSSRLDPGVYFITCKDKQNNILGYKELILSLPNKKSFDPSITFSKAEYNNGETIQADFKINPMENISWRSAKVKARIITRDDRLETERFRVKPNTTNELTYKLDEVPEKDVFLKGYIKIKGDRYYFFKKVPFQKEIYQITAMAEGNALVNNKKNKIALRIHTVAGQPLAKKTIQLISDATEEPIKTFTTDGLGHAFFEFVPKENVNYQIQLPEDFCYNPVRPLELKAENHKFQILRSDNEKTTIKATGERDTKIFQFQNDSIKTYSAAEKTFEMKNDQYAHFLMANKDNIILSDLIFLNDLTLVQGSSKTLKKSSEVKLMQDADIKDHQPLIFGVFHQNRSLEYINWNQYRLDYYFYPKYREILENYTFTESSDYFRLKLILAPFRKNYSSNEELFTNLQKQYPEYLREFLIQNLEVNNDLIYANGSATPPKTERIPAYKKRLAEGIDVPEVLSTIKPYQSVGGIIVFPGMKNSFNNQQGALIVLDGVKAGTSISILENLDPYSIESIEVITDPNRTLTYSGFANAGIVKIETKNGDEKKEKAGKDKLNLRSDIVWNVNVPFLANKNTRIVVPKNNKKGQFISFAFGYTKSGKPIIYTGKILQE